MHIYTVVLLRPQSLCEINDEEYGKDIYVALGVKGKSIFDAICAAKEEAYAADLEDWGFRAMNRMEIGLDDYTTCVVFPGVVRPVAFGWDSTCRAPYKRDR